jgi:DNA polymerase III subunit gamma/tau
MSDHSFIVSARKYRPENWDAVVGQKSITATLQNAIATGQIAQAYLFCGPRGVGKTTCARIFARSINGFEAGSESEHAFNIFELDAASNNSVEDIREITDQVRIPPQVGRFKVYIIDEVHMLSQAAFNAFLKTLEEPPAHAVFILATTEKHKILPTILSRCQIFDFHRIEIPDIAEHLAGIAQKENIEAEPEGLHIIAMKADGAMRDALSMLDQISAFSGGKVTYKAVIENLNILDYDYYFRMTDAVMKAEVQNALLMLNEILANGFDAHHFLNGMAGHMRDLLVAKDEVTIGLLETAESVKERYKEQAVAIDMHLLFACMKILNEADISYRTSKNPRLHTEIALIKMCTAASDGAEKKNDSRGDSLIPFDGARFRIGPKKPAQRAMRQSAPIVGFEFRKTAVRLTTPGGLLSAPAETKVLNTVAARQVDIPSLFSESKAEEPLVEMNEPYTSEQFAHAWNEYGELVKVLEKDMSHRAFLGPVPRIEEHTIHLEVPNLQQKEAVELVKTDFLQTVRDKLRNSHIMLEVSITRNEQGAVKSDGPMDVYQRMVNENPALDKLRELLKLEFDL